MEKSWRLEHATQHYCPECKMSHVSIFTICDKCWRAWVEEGIAYDDI